MALINTAGILAGRRGFRVLVIDVDLEAPGLSYIDPELPEDRKEEEAGHSSSQLGFVDLLCDAMERGKDADLFTLPADELASRYTQIMRLPKDLREFEDGKLCIMPAGKFDGEYAARLDSLQLGVLYRQGVGAPLIQAFKKRLIDSKLYDYVLVDSRTGFSDEAGICTRDLGDQLIILSGLNRQNVEGTSEFLKTLRSATDGKKVFQIVLSPVPNGEDKLFEKREDAASEAFDAAWQGKVDLSLQIPYHPQLALTEEPHIFRRHRGPLFDAYKAIEMRMLGSLGHTAAGFARQIIALLIEKNYSEALVKLNHIVRLEMGKDALSRIIENMEQRSFSRRAPGERIKSEDNATLKQMLDDSNGLKVLSFLIENFPLTTRPWVAARWLERVSRHSPASLSLFFQRLIDNPQLEDDTVLSYASFFENLRKWKPAEQLYKQLLEQHPESTKNLLAYGTFLENRRRYLEANTYYERAISLGGKTDIHEDYASFIFHYLGDLERAKRLYESVLAKTPEEPHVLANYGQLLTAIGAINEAEIVLLRAYQKLSEHFTSGERSNMAELIFSIWIVSRMQGHDAQDWERRFKWLITKGFDRQKWSFDHILQQASKLLPDDEFIYARALADAFLSRKKIGALDKFDRWKALDPLSTLQAEPLVEAS